MTKTKFKRITMLIIIFYNVVYYFWLSGAWHQLKAEEQGIFILIGLLIITLPLLLLSIWRLMTYYNNLNN